MDIAKAIRFNYLLHGLNEAEIGLVADAAQTKSFMGGDTIVRQFAKDADVMIVLEGDVRIKTFSGETIADAGPGSVIGEVSLIDDKPRSATVTSVGPSTLAMIPAKALWDLMDNHPNIAKNVLSNVGRILCSRLRAANIQLDLGVVREAVVRN